MFRDLIEAIHADLEANADLPDHETQLYLRPRAIIPEDCPLLVVWVIDDVPNLSLGTTVTFDYTVSVGVSWHVQVTEDAETMVRNDEVVLDALAVLERIRNRIRVMSTDGIGVDACHEVLPGISTPNAPALATGLVEGYATSVLCSIVEKAI